eukprot:640807_1
MDKSSQNSRVSSQDPYSQRYQNQNSQNFEQPDWPAVSQSNFPTYNQTGKSTSTQWTHESYPAGHASQDQSNWTHSTQPDGYQQNYSESTEWSGGQPANGGQNFGNQQ